MELLGICSAIAIPREKPLAKPAVRWFAAMKLT